MKTLSYTALIFAGALIAAGPAQAAVTLDFEGSSASAPPGATSVAVNGFYNGGTDSGGTAGTNYGITFTNANFDSTSQFTHPEFGITSSIAYMSASPLTLTSNTAFNSLDFDQYFFGEGNVVNVYSGANGTGSLVATQTFGQNCFATCTPLRQSLSFADALSVTISPNANGTGIDNITLAAVPEPATWAMMLLGFSLVGYGMRRRKHLKTAVSHA